MTEIMIFKNRVQKWIAVLSLCFLLCLNIFWANGRYLTDKNPFNFEQSQIEHSSLYNVTISSDYGYALDIDGNYAYIATQDGLAIVDISDPTNPSNAAFVSIGKDALAVFVSGDYVYLCSGDAHLVIIDISDPTNPGTPIYRYTIDSVFAVIVVGDYAYLATDIGLAIIDISDPTNPGTPIYKNIGWAANDIFIDGNYAFLACNSKGLIIIDISDPTNPGDPIFSESIFAHDVIVDGDYAFIAAVHEIVVIDVSDPMNPGPPIYDDEIYGTQNIFIDGDRAYAIHSFYPYTYSDRLGILDISNPTDLTGPIFKNTLENLLLIDVYVEGNYAFLLYADTLYHLSGLQVTEVYVSIDPPPPTYWDTVGGIAIGVTVCGDYVYIADYFQLSIMDISDPINPGTPVYQSTFDDATGLEISGDYIFIADGSAGLTVIDISDPTSPGPPINEDTSGYSIYLCVEGDFAYLADTSSGLAIMNISDPTDPGPPVYVPTSANANDVCVSGDYAYVACATSGLAIVDITNPTSPGSPIYRDTSGDANGIVISGDYAYIACGTSGLAVIDISNPTSPGSPVYRDTSGNAMGIIVDGDTAYLACGSAGLAIIDITEPTNPGTPIYENTAGVSHELALHGIYMYIADESTGLAIIQVKDYYDFEEPVIDDAPEDLVMESGYTGESVSWTATDLHPDEYSIELEGYGIVTGPIAWSSGSSITFEIPDGLDVGDYYYTINFTDSFDNFITDTVQVTVEDTQNPLIDAYPEDLVLESGYTEETLSWTATDPNPDTYTIELQGSGVVAGPLGWSSGISITFDIPDGLDIGDYYYTVNFTDAYNHFITETVKLTVEDTGNPLITDFPEDLILEYGYTGESLAWTATDPNPGLYTIELQGSGIAAGPISWSSGIAITFDIPDGLDVGEYHYTVNFTDVNVLFSTNTVKITVQDTQSPVIVEIPSDFTLEFDYSVVSWSWTATDPNPSIYTIELQGYGIVSGPDIWYSGIAVNFNLPEGLSSGVYYYVINFTDAYGNSATDTIKITINEEPPKPTISFGDWYWIFLLTSISALVVITKRKK